jgi:rhodanese-related sulfurtransferase
LIAVVLLLQRNAPAADLPAEVSVQQAQELVQNGAFLLDVRTQEEWNEAHVDGATFIPLDQLAQRINEIPKDRQVVAICRSGNRSAQGRDFLHSAGFTQVTSVAGGMNNWRAAGFPTVSGP